MPSRARAAAGGEKPNPSAEDAGDDYAASESSESATFVVGEDDGMHGADGLTVLRSAAQGSQAETAAEAEVTDAVTVPQPGIYRFVWPYACTYLLPDRTSKTVEPGDEVFWPDGAPDALWEFVTAEPAPAASDNPPRE